MDKTQIRDVLKKRRRLIPDHLHARWSGQIAAHVFSLPEYQNAEAVLAYYPIRSEVDTIPILQHALDTQKKLYLPCVQGEQMDFYRVNSLRSLVSGAFSIPQPEKNEDCYACDTPAVMLVPGVGFDFSGNRIGYGAGYYDRYFAAHQNVFLKIGLAFECQCLRQLAAEPFDIPMQMLITEKGIRYGRGITKEKREHPGIGCCPERIYENHQEYE